MRSFFTAFLILHIIFINAQTPLSMAPNFNVLDAKGNYHDLYSYLNDGKYVVLDFFYNECLVSQTHIPEVNDAFEAFGCNAHEVIFIGINYNNTDGEVILFEKEYNVLYPNVSGIQGGGNNIVSLYQIPAFPTIILIAPDRSIPKQDIWPLTAYNIIDELVSEGINTAVCPFASTEFNASNAITFDFYPNPATDKLVLEFTMDAPKDIVIEILDITGRTVFEKNLQRIISGASTEIISITHLHAGHYFLNVKEMDGTYKAYKLIKK